MPNPAWADWTDEQLLELRMCDLGLTIEGTELEARHRAAERRARGARTRLRPHYWLSDEWFTPDGVPGIAIPFYLAHPRLAQLELAQMLEVEGGDAESCLQDPAPRGGTRHRQRLPAAPAADAPAAVRQPATSNIPSTTCRSRTARASSCTSITGTRRAIPTKTSPRRSRCGWIPQSMWATRYAGWPAQRKLEYMDRLMRELARTRPVVTSRRQVDPLPRLKKTLGEHYRKKREHYGLDHPDFYDSDLRNLFSDAPEYAKNPSAARFVRRIRKEVRSTVASFTDSYQYTIDQLLEKIIERCRELNLRLTESEEATKIDSWSS